MTRDVTPEQLKAADRIVEYVHKYVLPEFGKESPVSVGLALFGMGCSILNQHDKRALKASVETAQDFLK